MARIRIEVGHKAYAASGEPVIADFRLTVDAHEFVCVVGPSGCGKTTLLNIVAGLDQDFDGAVTAGDGQSAPTIGYVFQNPRLLPWRTARQNLELALPAPPPPGLVDDFLQLMGLSEVQHLYPGQLSLGMSRRVAIIRAFMVNPELLLMDEPFVSLDAPTARQARELLIALWQKRPHAVLFVTHDLREAIALADRIIFLAARPMRVQAEVTVPLARGQRSDEAVEMFLKALNQGYGGAG